VSRSDGGVGEAYNLAVGRCSGAIVGSIDADNLLEPDAVERAVEIFGKNRGVAAVYGTARMIDERGEEIGQFAPALFDIAALLRCELVPPFAQSFFSREVCGPELRFDPRLKTCADFDLWLRLSHLPILRTDTIFGSVRLSGKSMTRKAANYSQFCADKVAAIDWFVARNPEMAAHRDDAAAGVYCWAVESLLYLEGPSARAEEMLERALSAAPAYDRAHRARAKLDEAIVAGANGEPNS
jgi:Glycosyl transferase family 2